MNLMSKRINITKGVNLNIISMEESKSNLLSVYFTLPLDREQVTKNALIPLVLKKGLRELNSNMAIHHSTEGILYPQLSVNIDKKGEKQIIRFTIEGSKPNPIKDKNDILEMIDLLKSIIFNPYLKEGVFSSQHIEEGKEVLERLIKEKKRDLKYYSISRCIEEMYKNEKYSLFPLGYIEDLDSIDNNTLYKQYLKILSQSSMEVFFVGEYKGYIEAYLKDAFNFEKGNIYEFEREYITGKIQTKNMIYEDRNIAKSRLVIGYRTGIPYENPLYNGLLITNQILGSGPNSKLLKGLKELKGIVNSIDSKVYKYKSFILIDSEIEFKNIEKVIKAIRNEIHRIRNGKFSQEDINISKESIKQSIESIKENNLLISEFFFDKVLTKDNRRYSQILDDIDKVTRDEIIKAANMFTLDTIYILRSFQASFK